MKNPGTTASNAHKLTRSVMGIKGIRQRIINCNNLLAQPVKGFTAKCARRSNVTQSLNEADTSVPDAMQTTGHKDPKVLLRYRNVPDEESAYQHANAKRLAGLRNAPQPQPQPRQPLTNIQPKSASASNVAIAPASVAASALGNLLQGATLHGCTLSFNINSSSSDKN